MQHWYSYVGEAAWGTRTEGGQRVADFVLRWRMVARTAGAALERARTVAEEARGTAPDDVRVLEVFELPPQEARLLNREAS